jgi:ElaB/YqjD/DUF883 family membrane-anchored ribosome-binding protein
LPKLFREGTSFDAAIYLLLFLFKPSAQEGEHMETPKTVPIGGNGSNGASASNGTSGTNGSWDRNVEQAKSTAHSTIDRLSENAQPTVEKLTATAHQAVDKLCDVASQATATFSGKMSSAKGSQQQLLDDTRAYVREKPAAAIAIAVAAGFLLRSLFRSR